EELSGELRLQEGRWERYAGGSDLPDGTQIALRLRAGNAGAETPWSRVPWMEKKQGTSRLDAEAGDGRPFLGAAGCARCHAEAPIDYVFRIQPPEGNSGAG